MGYGKNYSQIKNFIKDNKIKAKIILNEKKIDKFYKKLIYMYVRPIRRLPTTVIEAASNCVPIICSDFKSGANEILKMEKADIF